MFSIAKSKCRKINMGLDRHQLLMIQCMHNLLVSQLVQVFHPTSMRKAWEINRPEVCWAFQRHDIMLSSSAVDKQRLWIDARRSSGPEVILSDSGVEMILGNSVAWEKEACPCNILQYFHGCKNDNFRMIKCDVFVIFPQNIDRGYTLEPPQWGGSNEYPRAMF